MAASAAESGPIVHSADGSVRGMTVGDVHGFKGLPYASPPIGTLRWKPPTPVQPWSGIRDATRFGPAGIQPDPPFTEVYTDFPASMSEDCLSLNIWAPRSAQRAGVLVWIHGGALRSGWSSQAMFDGSALAARGIVVVSINYRVGVLGYLAHPELSAESPDGVSGNYGLLDQIMALQWIRRNIAAFGGDPSNVTIAGESAGALSVVYLMASPLARGLFARAIAQSAYMVSMPELKAAKHGSASAEALGADLLDRLGVKSIAELRAIEPSTLTNAAAKAGFAPWGTVDGHVLPRQLVDTFDRSEQAPVPILAGFTSGEARSLNVLLPAQPADAATYERLIRERYGELASEFLALYPSRDMSESILAAVRDAMYGWTAQRLVTQQTALGQPAFLYLFDHGYPSANARGLHAFHASEIPYVFGTLDRTLQEWPAIPATPIEAGLSKAMGDYWASFVSTGTPRSRGRAQWDHYGDRKAYLRFVDEPVAAAQMYPGTYEHQERVMRLRRSDGHTPWNWNVGIAAPPMPTGAVEQ